MPFTTETYLARALREVGCEVRELPQDEAFKMGASDFVKRTLMDPPELVLYVRTHNATALADGWSDAWQRLAAHGTRSASFHLDRFWGLRQPVPFGDRSVPREELIGLRDPLFTTEHVFTADGGNDDRWTAAGVNHHWLPPAVDSVEASWPGNGLARRYFDVIFAGSGRQYHAEYPQRAQLLDHLDATYGHRRYAHYGHGGSWPVVRQQDLNDVYAACAVVVGDSCFANEPGSSQSTNYWSDRIPETLGRGGFLIHPYVPGLHDHYGPDELATYNPGDWDDLDSRIGEFLANPGEREGFVERGRARVLRDHTYTCRMRELLTVCGFEVAVAPEAHHHR